MMIQSAIAPFVLVFSLSHWLPLRSLSASDLGVLPQIHELERAALAARRTIHSGHVTMTITGSNSQEAGYWWQPEVRFDRNCERADVRMKYDVKPRHADSDTYWDRWIIKPNGCYRYSDQILDRAEYVFSVDERHGTHAERWLVVPDFRTFGMTPFHSAPGPEFHIERFINGPNRDNIQVEESVWQDSPCWKILFDETEMGLSVAAWIDLTRGNNVVRMTADWNDRETTYHDESQTTILKHERTGLWYPARFKYFRTKNNDQTNHEVVEVEVHSLNEPIDPQDLTKKSLNVPAGTTVMLVGDPDATSHYWDGDNVVRANPLASRVVASAKNDQRLRWLLLAANAALIGLILLAWSHRKRKRSAP